MVENLLMQLKKVISERKKPIVVFKNGRTTRGAKQAASHTGSLGGTFAVVKGAFSQSGIISVDSYEELTSSLKALSWQPVPRGNRVSYGYKWSRTNNCCD